MAGASLFPVAAVLVGVAAAQSVLVGNLSGGLRAEFVSKEHLAGIKYRIVIIIALLHKTH